MHAKAPGLTHHLSVLVRADVDRDELYLCVSGSLTEATQHALHPLIRKARCLDPAAPVVVDLTQTHRLESAGLELLRRTVNSPEHHHDPVRFLIPDPLPASPGGENMELMGAR